MNLYACMYVCMYVYAYVERNVGRLQHFTLFFFLAENKNCGAGWEDDQTADCESKFPFILY